MRKHQRLNSYNTERANRKATRKAQETPCVAKPYEPATLAALRLHTKLAYEAYQAKSYPLPSKDAFVQRVDGVLKPTEYALSLLAGFDDNAPSLGLVFTQYDDDYGIEDDAEFIRTGGA